MATIESSICALCDDAGLERTRFFQRQMISASDLTQDQSYFLEKSRRHNRLLHGWGVVCGVRCKKGQGDCEVVIEPGYILGPYGDEIVVDREITIDVCEQDLDGNVSGPCGQPSDPWCSNIRIDRRAGDKLYIAVRYAECQDRPVQVMSAGCGCNSQECEYSRTRDSYVFRVLTKLPATYPEPMSVPDPGALLKCRQRARPCPACAAEPWVILADITLTSDSKIAKLDCFAHRRYVASFADFYFMCPQFLKISSVKIIGDQEPFELSVPGESILISRELKTRSIELIFDNAELDQNTINTGTFKVETSDAEPIAGQITQIGKTIRWTYEGTPDDAELPQGKYRVSIIGTGTNPIKSSEGIPLDGEYTQLPSGNDEPGGDFVFEFEIN